MDEYMLFAVLLIFLLAAGMMKMYTGMQAHNMKGLNTIMEALETLGPLNGTLWAYEHNPTPENKTKVREFISKAANIRYLHPDDLAFILDIDDKTDEELKAFSEKIFQMIREYMQIRDRFQRKVFGRTIP